MSLTPYLVPLSTITCRYKNKFNKDLLREAAQLIIQSGGVITPPVLRQYDIGHYEVIDGIFAYYAAVEASIIGPSDCKLVTAYIIGQGQDRLIADQIKLFRPQVYQVMN
ncbi:hypothetical protein TI04_05345, partial [Achromatium sp. WMS2]